MNRAERRRQDKIAGRVHVMTRYEEAEQKGYERGVRVKADREFAWLIRMYTTAFMASIINELGIGPVRARRVLIQMQETLFELQRDRSREPKLRAYVNSKIKGDIDDFTGARKLDIAEEVDQSSARMISPEERKIADDIAKANTRNTGRQINGRMDQMQ